MNNSVKSKVSRARGQIMMYRWTRDSETVCEDTGSRVIKRMPIIQWQRVLVMQPRSDKVCCFPPGNGQKVMTDFYREVRSAHGSWWDKQIRHGCDEGNVVDTDLLVSHQVTVGDCKWLTHSNRHCIMAMCITLAYFVNLLLQQCLGVSSATVLFALHESRRL
jgi:hypothetical protein